MRQIIALGGGGFSDEPENPLLDDYILAQSPKKNPSICFIGTASGDAQDYIDAFYSRFESKPCKTSHLSLFSGHTHQLGEFLLEQDILYVGGGNTRNLMVLWKEWGLDILIRKAYLRGTVLAGISAGSICWFEQGLSDSVPGQLTSISGMGILKGSNCPHFDSEPQRKAAYTSKIETGELASGIACDDGVALHFKDERFVGVVSSQEHKRAIRFEMQGQQLKKEILEPRFLGDGTS